jgi:hypothetical protein
LNGSGLGAAQKASARRWWKAGLSDEILSQLLTGLTNVQNRSQFWPISMCEALITENFTKASLWRCAYATGFMLSNSQLVCKRIRTRVHVNHGIPRITPPKHPTKLWKREPSRLTDFRAYARGRSVAGIVKREALQRLQGQSLRQAELRVLGLGFCS